MIDASIYSRQQAPDILGNVQRGLAIRDMMDQRALQKQQLQDQEATKRAYGAGMQTGPDGQVTFDPSLTVGALAKHNPLEAYRAQQQFAQQAQQSQEQKLKKSLQQVDLAGRLLGSAQDQESYSRALQTAQQLGLDISEMPQAYDPNLVNSYRMHALSTKEQLESQLNERKMTLQERELGVKQQAARGPGAAPAGYRWRDDGSLEPIPGGPEDKKRQDVSEAARKKEQMVRTRGRTVLRDVNRAMEQVQKAGPIAGSFSSLPVSSTYELKQHLDSIKSNISIDQLQQMRESSPTGGALGQVPVQQQEYLMSVLGSLVPTLRPDVLKENLQDVYNIYLDAMYGSEDELRRAVDDGRMTQQEAASAMAARQKESFDRFGQKIGSNRRGIRTFSTNEIDWAD